jgi:hypothetical protein
LSVALLVGGGGGGRDARFAGIGVPACIVGMVPGCGARAGSNGGRETPGVGGGRTASIDGRDAVFGGTGGITPCNVWPGFNGGTGRPGEPAAGAGFDGVAG